MPLIHIKGKAQYDSELKKAGNLPVVIDFYTDWCGPCKVIAPEYEKWSKTYEKKHIFLKVNADDTRILQWQKE